MAPAPVRVAWTRARLRLATALVAVATSAGFATTEPGEAVVHRMAALHNVVGERHPHLHP